MTIPEGVSFTNISDLNGETPLFSLTCISTGGPATTAIWTRDSELLLEGSTALDDTVTAQYTHTLTVAGRLEGLYVCNVSNNKPSSAFSELMVVGKLECNNISASVYSSTTFLLFIHSSP